MNDCEPKCSMSAREGNFSRVILQVNDDRSHPVLCEGRADRAAAGHPAAGDASHNATRREVVR